MNTHTIETFKKGIDLFNQGAYYECHDLLENIWEKSSGTEKIFLQSLIQLSVAFYHYQNKNLKGAQSLINKSLSKLYELPTTYCEINILNLVHSIEDLIDKLKDNEEPEELPMISYKLNQ